MRLRDFAGADPITLTVGATVIPNSQLGPVVIRHGRTGPAVRPDASTASFAVSLAALPTFPTIGDAVVVEYSTALLTAAGLAEAARRRFTGRITDVGIRPRTDVVTITAAGPLAAAARVSIGDVAWPSESDGARVARMLSAVHAANSTVPIGTVDPGTVTLLARAAENAAAGVLWTDVAAAAGGEVWQARDGSLRYTDAAARGVVTVGLTLDASDILADVEWTQALDGLVPDLTVGYGVPDGAGVQATVRVVDTVAADPVLGPGTGPLAAVVPTPLATAADATAYATLTVGRYAWPRWAVPALPVDLLRTLGDDAAGLTARAALLAAEPGLLIALTALPTDVPDTTTELWLEGWTESITAGAWRMALAVSPRGLTGPGIRWVNVPAQYRPSPAPGEPLPDLADLTWAAVPTAASGVALTWRTAAGWWPPATTALDRWADQPANLRWDSFDDSVTWGDM